MDAPNSFLASAPVVLPPNHFNGYFANGHHGEEINANQTSTGAMTAMTPNGSIPATPGSLAGRKRSRGDIYEPEDGDEEFEDGSVTTPIGGEQSIPRGKPVYGPGMTVIYPEDPGYAAAAESQSGTWLEDQATRKQFQLSHTKRPSVSSRKSQRRGASVCESDNLAQLVLPPQIREAAAEPLIDEATRALGISWTRMDSSEALQINKAAYSKWIQNHYPGLKDVAVWFENSALPGYLVEARNVYSGQQAYYIFSHDLTEARLVTTEPEQLVPRLRLLPALHLAAPGGHICAETDAIATVRHEQNSVLGSGPNGMSQFSHEVSQLREGLKMEAAFTTAAVAQPEPNGMCSAHEMELD